MYTVLTMLLSKLQSKLVVIGLAVGAIYSIYLAGRRSGSHSTLKSQDKELKKIKDITNETTKDVGSRTDDDVDEQLRRW